MTPEQKQKQLEQIQEHLAQRKAEARPLPSTEIYVAHVDFLLSLVKSQEATPSKSVVRRLAQQGAICRECLYSPTLDLVRLCQRHAAIDDAATSMRSACVEKLRERANRYQVLANDSLPNDQTAARTAAAAAALNSAANELETLSIEQPKE